MRVYKLYELRRYYANASSLAFYFDTATVLLITIVPWIISYVTDDLYITFYAFPEKPTISFSGKLLLYLKKEDDFIFYSNIAYEETFPDLLSNYRPPQTSFYTQQDPDSGENSGVNVHIRVPLLSSEKVIGLTVILLVDVTSWRFYNNHTDVSIVINKSFQSPVSKVVYSGDLVWSENYMEPFVKSRANFKGKTFPKQIFDTYSNLSEVGLYLLEDRIYVPTTLDSLSGEFELDFSVHFSSLRISTNPGFWYTIKFAWIQYLSIALIFFYFAEKMRSYAYGQQIVRTVVHSTIPISTQLE
ncbi:unnamed protein product [Heterobilharzia americana]|nr:unnamed protein product [Heterobilharzia americana]CAH8637171.1 unnamed protein product [Heterobilharzia americana]